MSGQRRQSRKHDRVIAFGSPKEAALYFDQVLPVDFSLPTLASFLSKKDTGGSKVLEELTALEVPVNLDELRPVLKSLSRGDEIFSNGYAKLIPLNVSPWVGIAAGMIDGTDEKMSQARRMIQTAGIDVDDFLSWIEKKNGINLNDFYARYKHQYDAVLAEAGLADAPTWSGNLAPYILRSEGEESEKGFAVLLHDLEMIDASKLSWEHVIAFRDDPDHMRSLRDFRLYFQENNFEKADPVYVRDRLEQAIEEHRLSAKFWGFETAKKTFAVAADKGNLALSGLAGLASALAGAPMATAALLGTAVTTASCVFEFAQVYIDERKARLTRPLRFLTKLDKLANKDRD